MANSLALGVRFTAAATGGGSFASAGAVMGYDGVGGLTSGKSYGYRAENAGLTEWEWGYGTWNGTNLTRNVVKSSTGGGTVSFTTLPQVGIIPLVGDILSFVDAMSLTTGEQDRGRANIGVVGQSIARNPDFRINQRGYASGTTLAAGSFGHDGYKAGAGGGDYQFTQLKSSTAISINASKTLIQVIPEDDIAGGTYVLSWSGTAQARIGLNSATPSGAYASSPIVIAGQTANTKLSFEFGNGASAGTLEKIKLELGTVPTPFQMQSLEYEQRRADYFCQRYLGPSGAGLGNGASLMYYWSFPLRAKMYGFPSVLLPANIGISSDSAGYTINGISSNQCTATNFLVTATTTSPVAPGFVVLADGGAVVLLTAEP